MREKAAALRQAGSVDFAVLRNTFRDRLLDSRKRRNVPGSYSILVPDESSLAMPQVAVLDAPDQILLCTDGFCRAVDTYGMHDDASLLAASAQPGGVLAVTQAMRRVEAEDTACIRHPRFKQADDVSAVMLVGGLGA